jgi:hypothetical protein
MRHCTPGYLAGGAETVGVRQTLSPVVATLAETLGVAYASTSRLASVLRLGLDWNGP